MKLFNIAFRRSKLSAVGYQLSAVIILVICSLSLVAQNVSINANGAAPDSSAMLDVQSTTRGFLPPRMTIAQRNAIAAPADGLMIFQTDSVQGNYVYYNSTWNHIAGLSAAATGSLNTNNSGVVYFRDVKSSGTAGGTFTSGAWQTRVLNTIDGDTSFAELSSNQFTLQPGTYMINVSAPTYNVNRHKIKLRDISNSADLIIGESEHASVFSAAKLTGTFVLNTNTTFEIQHRSASTGTTSGFGIETSFGVDEVYTQVELIRLEDFLSNASSSSVNPTPGLDSVLFAGNDAAGDSILNLGALGIGTTSPFGDLNIHRASGWPDLALSSNINSGAIFGSISFHTPVYNASNNRSDAIWQMGFTQGGASSSASDRWYIGRSGISSADLVVNRSGRVGIGVNNPTKSLDVNGGATMDTLNINSAFTFPSIDGSNGQVLKTDGTGNLSWQNTGVLNNTLTGTGTVNRMAYFFAADSIASHDDVFIDAGSNRLGIGTAAPQQKLHVVGSTRTTAGFLANAGTNGTPSYRFDADANTGLYNPGADQLGISAGGVARLLVTTTGLTINSVYTLPYTDGTNGQVLTTNGTGAVSWGTVAGDGNGIYSGSGSLSAATTVTQAANTLAFTSTATNGFSVDGSTFSVDAANNRVGFGTTSPSYHMHLLKTTGTANFTMETQDTNWVQMRLVNSERSYGIGTTAYGNLAFIDHTAASNSIRMRLDSTGRFGIGSSNPAYKLDVAGTIRSGSNANDGQLRIYSEQGATDYEVVFNPNAAMTQNTTYTLPADDGGASQVLTTDGAGVLSWGTVAGDGNGIYSGSGSLSAATTVTQAANTLAFTSTATNGFSVDGTTFSVDAANNRIGVGTAAPAYPIDVNGAIRSGIAGLDGQFRMYSEQGATDYEVVFNPAAAMTQNTTYTLPVNDGGASQVLTTDGTGVLSWAAPTGDGNGIYSGSGSLSAATTVTQAANTLAFTSTATNGFSVDGNTFSVDAANNRIGIGTSAPAINMHISATSNPELRVQATDATSANLRLLTTVREYNISSSSAGALLFTDATSSAVRFRVDPTGQFGIGSITPTYKLDVEGPIRSGMAGTDGQLRVYSEQGATDYEVVFNPAAAMTQNTTYTLPANDGAASQVLTTNGAGALSWAAPTGDNLGNHFASQNIELDTNWLSGDGDDEGIYVNASGRVGFGTNVPDARFHILDNSGPLDILLETPDTASAKIEFRNALREYRVGVNADSSFTINDASIGVRRLIMTATGKFGLGMGNSGIPSYPLDVKGAIRAGNNNADGQLRIYSEQGATDYEVVFNPPATMTQNTNYTLPANDGNANDMLISDGSGVLSWGSSSAIGNGIYSGSGSLSGATTVTQGANTLAFTSTATNGFSVDGTTFSVDAANNRVGIGTAAPAATLEVRGTASTTALSLNSQSNVTATNADLATIDFSDNQVTTAQARILAERDAVSSGATDLPTRLTFFTSKDQTASALERLRINNRGRVSIGGVAPSAMFNVEGSDTASYHIDFGGTNNLTASGGGILFNTAIVPTVAVASVFAVNATPSLSNSANNVTSFFGMYLRPGTVASYTGTATNFYSLYVASPGINAASTVTNAYGVRIAANATAATNKWGLYVDSDDSYFGGNVGMGTTTPLDKLHVTGGNILVGNNFGLTSRNSANTASYRLISVDASDDVIIGGTNWNNMEFDINGANDAMVIVAGGNIGMGTTVPSEQLEVIGNIEIPAANNYTYATGQTRYKAVSASALSEEGGNFFSNLTPSGNNYYFAAGTAGTVYRASANIDLPDGAIVTSLTAYVLDNDATYNTTVQLLYQTYGNSTSSTTAFSVTSAGSSATVQTLTTNSTHTVDNSSNVYKIRFDGRGSNPNLSFYNVRITYTVTKAD